MGLKTRPQVEWEINFILNDRYCIKISKNKKKEVVIISLLMHSMKKGLPELNQAICSAVTRHWDLKA